MRSTLFIALAGVAVLAACSKTEPAAEPVRAGGPGRSIGIRRRAEGQETTIWPFIDVWILQK